MRARGRTGAVASGEKYPRAARLRSGREIRETFREGRRRRQGELELFVRPSPASRPRLAFVVPLHGHSIVERNRVKRRLREVARREWLPRALEEGVDVDVVVRARRGAYDTSFESLRAALLRGLESVQCEDSSSG